MKVLLVGGSGYVGSHLARFLIAQGHQVTVASRRGEGPVAGVRYVVADAARGEGLDEAAAGQEALIYLVGIIRERGDQTFRQAHVEGVRHSLRAAQRAGLRRFVHMSALGASRGTGIRYFETKAEGEELVQSSGLDWTILRPSLIFGQGDEFFGKILRGLVAAPLPFIPLIGDGSFVFRPIWVGDVAAAFAQALERSSTAYRSYNLVGPKEYTLRELLLLVRDTLGSKKPLLSIPLALMDRLVPLISPLPFSPITLDQYRQLKRGNTADPIHMRQAFSLEERPLEVELPSLLGVRHRVGA
ncbi:MAG: complex I NDUFA9 subunit family protein [Meiothermus sp.]|uniref:complex I NDUFA9 subunit family protein n=1 Tax=Meiothermus sp. TaxID=1955249 RepID=UPI0025D74D27|nr:complex I NDUFA9 subunit family protein [Meiothermus sp.]MCS7057766.1 complex I NDUFA9 subunit family protein [Meiothermus sp.]MCS7194609.1 complex I NDUFA9 subunit family protein [Meiothermus sp.]MCX7740798.1 complex I NDUFA9 subunit family protein [Meiothermus sp.]MDW8090982.1 complex I NDUFA9 subunit family protein [Meiothermus sp.]MDW8481877.1 complex I NDUFA9 subunit family protein [Meiothermus sp.]